MGARLAKQTLLGTPEPKAPTAACPVCPRLGNASRWGISAGAFSLSPLSPSCPGHLEPPVHQDRALWERGSALFSCCSSAYGCHCSHRDTAHATKPSLTPWAPRSEKKTVGPLQSLPWGEGRNGDPRVPQTTPHLCLQSSSLLCRAAPRPRPAVTGGLATPALCHLLSLVCVLLGQRPGHLATQPPKQFPESRRLQQVLLGLSLLH